MVAKSPPIQLRYAKVVFRILFDAVEISEVELTSHFTERQKKWIIYLVDVLNTMEKGYIKKEYRPDRDHKAWRWALCYKDITIIFNIDMLEKRIVFITCWRGKEPPEGKR